MTRRITVRFSKDEMRSMLIKTILDAAESQLNQGESIDPFTTTFEDYGEWSIVVNAHIRTPGDSDKEAFRRESGVPLV